MIGEKMEGMEEFETNNDLAWSLFSEYIDQLFDDEQTNPEISDFLDRAGKSSQELSGMIYDTVGLLEAFGIDTSEPDDLHLSMFPETLTELTSNLESSRERGSFTDLAIAAGNMGMFEEDAGNFEASRDRYDEAIEAAEQVDEILAMILLTGLARVLGELEDYENQLSAHERFLELAVRANDFLQMGVGYMNIAKTRLILGHEGYEIQSDIDSSLVYLELSEPDSPGLLSFARQQASELITQINGSNSE